MATTPLRSAIKRSTATREAAAPARRTRGAGRPAAAAARGARATAPDVSAHDQLVAIKASLEAVNAKLNGVDPNGLSDSEHAQWSDELNRVDLAIARVRNSLLNGIVAEFEAAMPGIQASTARAEADLARLNKAVDIINAVAGVLGVVEQIIRLGR